MMGFDTKKIFNGIYFRNFILKNLDLDWIQIQQQPGSGSIFVKTYPNPSAFQAWEKTTNTAFSETTLGPGFSEVNI
jgi:hypothetical protein